MWFHKFIADHGYCSPKIPKLATRIGPNNSIRYLYRMRTWTYSSFYWIIEGFYPNGIKIIPRWVGDYLTPLALAVWIMGDGSIVSSGMK